VMLILTVFLMQHGVIGEMKLTSGPNLPNVFLVDISSKELDGVKHLLEQQPAVQGDVETVPSVAGRIISVDGTAADELNLKDIPSGYCRRYP
jgi:putative ABC transport system permease protein